MLLNKIVVKLLKYRLISILGIKKPFADTNGFFKIIGAFT